jgi:3-methyladenine DNA glycosylase/8-oxoguanine DNA glycosylase
MSKAKSILDMIKHRQKFNWIYNTVSYEEPVPPEIASQQMSADDWQEFKRKFVEEYGGEKIQDTGMTHSEFMDYIKTSGSRENDEFKSMKQSRTIREILEKMDRDARGLK